MSVRWLDNSRVLKEAVRSAQEAGLKRGANVYRNAVIRWIRDWHGYLTTLGNIGDFYRDGGIQFISVGPIESGSDPFIRVGSSWPVHRYWELGHHNLFTRHFERDERWRPAYEESREQILAAYMRGFTQAVRDAGFDTRGIGAVSSGDSGEAAS